MSSDTFQPFRGLVEGSCNQIPTVLDSVISLLVLIIFYLRLEFNVASNNWPLKNVTRAKNKLSLDDFFLIMFINNFSCRDTTTQSTHQPFTSQILITGINLYRFGLWGHQPLHGTQVYKQPYNLLCHRSWCQKSICILLQQLFEWLNQCV